MEQLDEAGGVFAVMHELSKKNLLDLNCLTVTGQTGGENIAGCENQDRSVIRPVEEPYSETGGIAVLRGQSGPGGQRGEAVRRGGRDAGPRGPRTGV